MEETNENKLTGRYLVTEEQKELIAANINGGQLSGITLEQLDAQKVGDSELAIEEDVKSMKNLFEAADEGEEDTPEGEGEPAPAEETPTDEAPAEEEGKKEESTESAEGEEAPKDEAPAEEEKKETPSE